MVADTVCVYGYVHPRNDCSLIGMEKSNGRKCKTTVWGTGLGCSGFSVGVGIEITSWNIIMRAIELFTTNETRIVDVLMEVHLIPVIDSSMQYCRMCTGHYRMLRAKCCNVKQLTTSTFGGFRASSKSERLHQKFH